MPETVTEDPIEGDPIDHAETPRCDIHPTIQAESICDECGRNICGKDMTASGTTEICNDCFEEHSEDAIFGVPYAFILGSVPVFIIVLVFILLNQ